uniref:C2H2-type domain-containing protein n=1 Tax=Megaselia scalaris TaxID=36166 RepID=T1GS39_MEGSC
VIKCTQCYRKFFDEEKYKKHLEAHEKDFDLAGQFLKDSPTDDKKVVKQYTCSFCSKDFVVVFDNKQAKRRYACDECREKYSNENELKKRKEEMMGNQEFICTKCNRKFVFEGFLQRHMTKCDGSIKRKREPKTGPQMVIE